MRPVLSSPQASTVPRNGDYAAGERDLLTAPSELAGRIVAEKYQLIRLLGRGGMGVVYEATHRWTGRRVALKLIHPLLADDPTLATRFLQEARAAARLEHPHVVEVLDMGRADDGTVYQALCLLQGETLGERLRREGDLGWRKILSLLLPVIDALLMAHAKGVIHRDVKPENIFLHRDPKGELPILLDFGMAKLLDGCSAGTPSSTAMGTPYYMAPEQAVFASTVGPAADVWSMGAILFTALSGELPFGKLPAVAYLAQLISCDVRPLRDVAPEVPAALASVVDRALQRDLSRRFPSMTALAEALCTAAHEIDPSFEAPLVFRTLPSEPVHTSRSRFAWFATAAVVASLCAVAFLPGTKAQPKPAVSDSLPRSRTDVAVPAITLPEAAGTAPTAERETEMAPQSAPKRRGSRPQTAPAQREVAVPDPVRGALPPGMTEEW